MSAAFPSGTVTFLFTDVEGSTRLLGELGAARYGAALEEHREIVRRALAAHGGAEVDTQGDAFFCAFASARSAVACARDLTEALEATPIRVRIGVHTGEALLAGDHYVGMDVHRAARIGACGHGGQVVLSPTTVALLQPAEFPLADLGEHRLKDLSAPIRIHQLGNRRFPALKTLYRTNLPVPATAFLGREEELRELAALAAGPRVRALTLTGTGGTGKTRLAVQLAAEIAEGFPDGAWWVPLAPLGDATLVASSLASVLELEDESGRDVTGSIVAALEHKKALILLDNCEHLVDAAAALASAIVAGCPGVLVLATSREALAIVGEHVFPVEPLVEGDAAELFAARARAAGATLGQGDEDVVVRLCRRLDNLPLAVELAAARAAALPPATLLERLSSGLDVLKGPRDVEERQRTLRAAIAWSHGLLGEPEQALFRRLGVFAGGASLAAAEEVCDADLEDLLSLVAKSLVRHMRVDGDDPRYWMLETIREFAAEELASAGELEDLGERHLAFYSRLASEALAGLEGPDSGAWLVRFEADLENYRAAFRHAVALMRPDDAVRLACALTTRHSLRGRYSESESVIRETLALELDAYASAELHDRLARSLRVQGRPGAALEAFGAAEAALGSILERDAEWWSRWIDLRLDEATFFYFENAQVELAALVGELEGLVAERGTPQQALALLHVRAQHAYRLERYAPSAETEALVRETYQRAVELRDVSADFLLGFCLLWRDKPDEAEECFVRGRADARRRGVAVVETRCLVYGAVARRRRGDLEGAREWIRELDSQDELHGYRGLTAAGAAWVAWRDGDLDLARTRGEEALADWESRALRGSRVFEWTARFPLLGVALAHGAVAEAVDHARAMLDESQQPLPEALRQPLHEAVVSGVVHYLEDALEIARPLGYA